MSALLDDADLRMLEQDALSLERCMAQYPPETLSERVLAESGQRIRALLDHIKALTEAAPGYVLTTYEDTYPGDEDAVAQMVLASGHIYTTIENAQAAAHGLVRRATQPVFALVPVAT